jgi:hypothetical protein
MQQSRKSYRKHRLEPKAQGSLSTQLRRSVSCVARDLEAAGLEIGGATDGDTTGGRTVGTGDSMGDCAELEIEFGATAFGTARFSPHFGHATESPAPASSITMRWPHLKQ